MKKDVSEMVDVVRENLRNAVMNDHDMLADNSDIDIADDIIEKTGQFEDQRDDLIETIAFIRLEGID